MPIYGWVIVGAFLLVALFAVFVIWVARMITDDECREQQRQKERLEEKRREEQAARIRNFPEKHLTQEEFDQLPNGRKFESNFLETCPIGTWFKCHPSDICPDIIVIGQVVKGGNMLCDQWGAGLCIPERGINRYRAIIKK